MNAGTAANAPSSIISLLLLWLLGVCCSCCGVVKAGRGFNSLAWTMLYRC